MLIRSIVFHPIHTFRVPSGNHQELLRCLVLEGWIGGANLDISPDDQYMGGGMPPHFGL